jgi:hypothetical protein
MTPLHRPGGLWSLSEPVSGTEKIHTSNVPELWKIRYLRGSMSSVLHYGIVGKWTPLRFKGKRTTYTKRRPLNSEAIHWHGRMGPSWTKRTGTTGEFISGSANPRSNDGITINVPVEEYFTLRTLISIRKRLSASRSGRIIFRALHVLSTAAMWREPLSVLSRMSITTIITMDWEENQEIKAIYETCEVGLLLSIMVRFRYGCKKMGRYDA